MIDSSDPRFITKANQLKVDKSWGYEIWIANSPLYCGKKLFIKHNHCSSQHFHMRKTETLYVVSGRLKLDLWENAQTTTLMLEKGDSFLITPGLVHKLTAPDGDVVLHEFSTEHFDDDSYRIAR